MYKTLRWVGMVLAGLSFLAVLGSCNTSRRLGCPMKITQNIHEQTPFYLQSKAYAYAPDHSGR